MPGLFEQFPHTNLHELNLDWIIDLINKFKEELEDSAVLSVNGQTGHVTLYESENVILPALPSGVDQWRLVRMMNGQYAGILFYNGNVYLQRGNSNMRLLTLEDIPTSAGVVAWNGRTGIVNVTGQDIPVDDTADADSIEQAIKNEHTERVNADNALQNSINQAVGNMQIVRVDKFVTVQSGTGETSNTQVDLSEYIPSGKHIAGISQAILGEYVLPYFNNNNVPQTYIEYVPNLNSITITNKTSAWTNFKLRLILFIA